MLEPRFRWPCYEEGCCVFAGGTAEYDIYMGGCHAKPWDPSIVLVHGDPDAREWFQTALAKDLPGTEILIPKPGQQVDIS